MEAKVKPMYRILPVDPRCLACKRAEAGVQCPPCEVYMKSYLPKPGEVIKCQTNQEQQ
jgi:hypothetical protein